MGIESHKGTMEQRMEMVSYAVITLFFAVMKMSANDRASHNGLRIRELQRIIRRSQERLSEFTLLITLLPAKAKTRDARWKTRKLGEKLELPKLAFQVIRRTFATLGQKKRTPKDIQGLLRQLSC